MNIKLPDKERFTPAEVSDLLSVSRETVLIWIRAGKLYAEKYGHRIIRISRQSIEDFLAQSEIKIGIDTEEEE